MLFGDASFMGGENISFQLHNFAELLCPCCICKPFHSLVSRASPLREAEGLDTLRRMRCDNAGMLAGPIRFVDCL